MTKTLVQERQSALSTSAIGLNHGWLERKLTVRTRLSGPRLADAHEADLPTIGRWSLLAKRSLSSSLSAASGLGWAPVLLLFQLKGIWSSWGTPLWNVAKAEKLPCGLSPMKSHKWARQPGPTWAWYTLRAALLCVGGSCGHQLPSTHWSCLDSSVLFPSWSVGKHFSGTCDFKSTLPTTSTPTARRNIPRYVLQLLSSTSYSCILLSYQGAVIPFQKLHTNVNTWDRAE